LDSNNIVLKQIKADMYNIQVALNSLPGCNKTRYTITENYIRQTIKDIKRQKDFISDTLYQKHFRHHAALFEVEHSDIEQMNITDITSYFGFID